MSDPAELTPGPDLFLASEEYKLIRRIKEATTPEERERWIVQLEQLPIKDCCFYERWRRIYDVGPFECWDDEQYDPSRSPVPRDIQILCAMEYGTSDIQNGGLHQFFGNGTGNFAPEMAEWCERSGLKQSAAALRAGMAVFGPEYPRSQMKRGLFLDKFTREVEAKNPRATRDDWDPFAVMDQQFWEGLKDVDPAFFNAAKDRWLREVCGIDNLRTPPVSGR